MRYPDAPSGVGHDHRASAAYHLVSHLSPAPRTVASLHHTASLSRRAKRCLPCILSSFTSLYIRTTIRRPRRAVESISCPEKEQ